MLKLQSGRSQESEASARFLGDFCGYNVVAALKASKTDQLGVD